LAHNLKDRPVVPCGLAAITRAGWAGHQWRVTQPFIGDDVAVMDTHDMLALPTHIWVMGDHDDRKALRVQLVEERHDLRA
jgi:hypothetical protein